MEDTTHAGTHRTAPLAAVRRSAKAVLVEQIAGLIAGAAIIAAGWLWARELVPPLATILVGLAVATAGFLSGWIKRLMAEYRLFPGRLEVERGIFTRNIDNLELFRVRDVGVRQGVLGRLLDYGDVYVHSTDSSMPHIHLVGVDDPRGLYQMIRDEVTQARATHRTLVVEEAGGQSELGTHPGA